MGIEGRLVVRNLVYDISEKHIRGLFSKYGDIQEINLPLNPATNKSKGFAFVQFENKNQALKAIKVGFFLFFCGGEKLFIIHYVILDINIYIYRNLMERTLKEDLFCWI